MTTKRIEPDMDGPFGKASRLTECQHGTSVVS